MSKNQHPYRSRSRAVVKVEQYWMNEWVNMRKSLADSIQKEMDEGWVLRGQFSHNNDVYCTFVRKERI